MDLATRRDAKTMISAGQLRAARGLIGWSPARLAEASGLALQTIERLEKSMGPAWSAAEDVSAVIRALERAGVEFTDGNAPGVRLRPEASFIRPEDLTSETDL